MIGLWKKEKVNDAVLAILIKNAVLNDSLACHVPAILQLEVVNVDEIERKPSLVEMYLALDSIQCPPHTMKRGLKRATQLTETRIMQHAFSVHEFVRQLSNRDDHKKRH